MAAGGIRMGGVFVEIGADAAKFFTTLNGVNKEIGKIGKSMVSIGTRMAGVGVGLAAPIAAAVRQGANFESTLLNIKASTGATVAEVDQIKAAAMGMSQALGVGPTEAAQGMLELLKAGMSLQSVLGGAGQAAIQFAKVGEMDIGRAAVVMSDAMNVFGVSGDKAANTLSAAADASSTSITQMAEAFSMSSAVAGLANQSIDDLSAALAILANAGVKGSDAGTSVKTMLMRLMAPADDAAEALGKLGLSTQSFRGADGKMRPMVEIIGTINQAMQGLDQTAKDDVFRRIFGADAIRSASILSSVGVSGFQGMRDAMAQAAPVGEKFQTLMSGLSGAGQRAAASIGRLAVAISDAVSPAVMQAAALFAGFASGLAKLIGDNKELVTFVVQLAAGLTLTGGAMAGVGMAIQAMSYGFAGLGKAAYLVVAPLALIVTTAFSIAASFVGALAGAVAYAAGAVAAATATAAAWGLANVPLLAMAGAFLAIGGLAAGVVASLVSGAADVAAAVGESMQPSIQRAGEAFVEIKRIGVDAFGAIKDAIAGGDLQGAMEVAIAGLQAAFSVGSRAFMDSVDEWGTNLVNAFDFYISSIPFLRFAGADKYKFSIFGSSENATTPDQRADTRFQDMEARKAKREKQATDSVAAFDQTVASSQKGEIVTPSTIEPAAATPAAGTPASAEIAVPALAEPSAPREPIPAAPDLRSMASVAGTFSSLNLNASLGTTSVTERIARAVEETAKNTRDMRGDRVAA